MGKPKVRKGARPARPTRLFVSEDRVQRLRACLSSLLEAQAVDSVRALCERLNQFDPPQTIHPNRVHAILSGGYYKSLNPASVVAIEDAVAAFELSDPALFRAVADTTSKASDSETPCAHLVRERQQLEVSLGCGPGSTGRESMQNRISEINRELGRRDQEERDVLERCAERCTAPRPFEGAEGVTAAGLPFDQWTAVRDAVFRELGSLGIAVTGCTSALYTAVERGVIAGLSRYQNRFARPNTPRKEAQ